MTLREALIAAAESVLGTRMISADSSCGCVASALMTEQGNIYKGVCLDAPCSLGFCAEQAAVAAMLTAGESRVMAIVAVHEDGRILPPCGRCRELLYQIDHGNITTRIFLPDGSDELRNLLPCLWN